MTLVDCLLGPFHRFFNDPIIQEMIHVRGEDIPGINFMPEEPKEVIRRLSDGNITYHRYYAPSSWEVCNDDINEQLRGTHPLSCVPAIQFLVQHIR